jgi:hypothetical protein
MGQTQRRVAVQDGLSDALPAKLPMMMALNGGDRVIVVKETTSSEREWIWRLVKVG